MLESGGPGQEASRPGRRGPTGATRVPYGESDAMPDWDVVVVGAGSNGLVLAAELAARGLKVLALEARLEAGGLLTTEECTVHGYWHNVLGGLFNAFEATPAYQVLDLERENARYAVPEVQAALPLQDGRAVVFTTDAERTYC